MRFTKLDARLLGLGALLLMAAMMAAATAQERPRIEIVHSTGHVGKVTAGAFSPNGTRVLSGGEDGTVRLWDAATGALIHSLEGHSGGVAALAFSGDGARMLSAGFDGIMLWEAATGRLIRAFDRRPGLVASIALSPNGTRVLASGIGGPVELWDADTGQVLQTFQHVTEQGHNVTSVAFSPDGTRVLTGGQGDKPAKLWDAETGRLIRSFGQASNLLTTVRVAFSADGARILVGNDRSLTVWDAAQGTLIQAQASGHFRTEFVAFSQDGALVASGGSGGMEAWDVKTSWPMRAANQEGANVVAVSPDHTRALSVDQTLTLWDTTTGLPLRDFVGLAHPIVSVAVSRDGTRVISGGLGGTIGLWDTATGRPVWRGRLKGSFKAFEQIAAVAFSSRGARAISRDSSRLALWDGSTGYRIRAFRGSARSFTPVAFSTDGTLVASGGEARSFDDELVNVWDVATGIVGRTLLAPPSAERRFNGVQSLALSPDGAHIAWGSGDGSVKIWDKASGSLVHSFDVSPAGKPGTTITAVAFSPDGRLALSAGHDGATLKLWDIAAGQLVRVWQGNPRITSLAFLPDGGRVLAAGGNATFDLWDTATGGLIRTLAGHSADVTSLAVSGDGGRIYSGSRDGTLRVWDTESGGLLATLLVPASGGWLAATPEGFFDASAEAVASGVLSAVRGLDVVGIDQVTGVLKRPDLVRAKLRGDPEGKVRAATGSLDLAGLLGNVSVPAPSRNKEPIPNATTPVVEVVQQMGHPSIVQALALSPDGRFALSGSGDKTVILWDAASGRQLRGFEHGNRVTSVAFSPSGRLVLSGGDDNVIKLWDAVSGKELRRFAGHRLGIEAVAFSPDGRFALSGGRDRPASPGGGVSFSTDAGSMKLWEVATGKLLRSFDGHGDVIHAVAFSPDLRFVLSGSGDKTAKLWDVSTATALHTFRHDGGVRAVAFSPDGRHVLSAGDDKTMKLWEAATGKELRRFAHTRRVSAAAFSPDGRLALSGSRYERKLARDGRTAFSAGETMTLWDVATGKQLRGFFERSDPIPSDAITAEFVENPTRVAFSPDGRFILSDSGGTMKLWDAATGKQRRWFVGNSYSVSAVAFSPDGQLALSNVGKTMSLWDVATGKELRSFDKSWWGTAVAFSPDGQFVLAATHGSFERRMVDTPARNAVAFSPDGRLALSGSGWALKLWETATGKEVRSFAGAEVASKADSTAILWDVATGQELRRFVGHQDVVTSVVFSADGSSALSGSRDRTMKLWDVATGKETRSFGVPGRVWPFEGVSVVLSADGRFALKGSAGGLEAWEVSTGKLLGAFPNPDGSIDAVAFSKDGRFAVSGGGRALGLWDMATGKQLRTFSGHTSRIDTVAFSPDGRLLMSGSNDDTTRLWDVANGRELARRMAGPGDEWLMMTPDGFFSSSHRDTGMLSIVRGLEFTTIGQMHQSLFNPDLVREALRGDPEGEVKRAAKVVNLERVVESGPPPSIATLSPEPDSSSGTDLVTVSARITDRGKGIGRIEWRVNGVTSGVTSAPAGSGPDYDVRQTLALDPGANRIEVIAYERRNLLASLPARTTIRFSAPPDAVKPKLHVLAIGINAYADKGGASQESGDYFPPLSLAVADAKAFAAELRKAGAGLYSEVHVTEALDTDATAASLERIIDRMSARISPRDTFVLFAAAHGTSRDGRFYLIPQDHQGGTGPKALAERAIDQERLQGWVANRVKARKAIILLDTCESGALVSGYTKSRTDVPASEAAIGRLHEATGRPVLTAAASGKPAFEGYQGHGVFTFALMEALHHGDSSGNGVIEVSELVAHVQRRVPHLSAELNGRGISMVAARGSKDDKQSAHFGSTGEDFALVGRLP